MHKPKIPGGRTALFRFPERHGITLKKSPARIQQERVDVEGVRQAIEAVGAMLPYLPPYSPDLNPIEKSYSMFKAFLHKCAERTEQALRCRAAQFVRRLQPA